MSLSYVSDRHKRLAIRSVFDNYTYITPTIYYFIFLHFRSIMRAERHERLDILGGEDEDCRLDGTTVLNLAQNGQKQRIIDIGQGH